MVKIEKNYYSTISSIASNSATNNPIFYGVELMIVEIVDFKPEHLETMEMREHESKMDLGETAQLISDESTVSKTVLIDGKILTTYGIFGDNALWQIPSKHIDTISIKYAKATIKIVKDLIKGRKGIHSICLNDEFHARWMKFLGFKPTEKTYNINGNECILYEVKDGN